MGASAWGHVNLVKQLLKLGANPNLKDKFGNTSLHHCDYLSCMQILLENKGDISIKNNDGQMPVQFKQECLSDLTLGDENGGEYLDEEEEEEDEIEIEKEKNNFKKLLIFLQTLKCLHLTP